MAQSPLSGAGRGLRTDASSVSRAEWHTSHLEGQTLPGFVTRYSGSWGSMVVCSPPGPHCTCLVASCSWHLLPQMAFRKFQREELTWFLGSRKERTDKLGFIKFTHFCCGKDKVRRMRRQAAGWEETRLVKDCYPQYTKNSKNSTVRKQTAQLRNG